MLTKEDIQQLLEHKNLQAEIASFIVIENKTNIFTRKDFLKAIPLQSEFSWIMYCQ